MGMLGYSPRWRPSAAGPGKDGGDYSRKGSFGFLVLVVLVSNVVSHGVMQVQSRWAQWADKQESWAGGASLYLMDQAANYVRDTRRFEEEVRDIAHRLEIRPEWLMAVMFAESRFDPAVTNARGSGATGLIQFMPFTAEELGVTIEEVAEMDHFEQLDLVYRYLRQVQRQRGSFASLTDLYLGILYPKAVGGDACYALYGCGSTAYKQNSGLDENKDGMVTISDIDQRMKRLFPDAYVLTKP